ncbi:hypothetical protein DMP17_29120 [Pseudonocardia sp. TMWB2A]
MNPYHLPRRPWAIMRRPRSRRRRRPGGTDGRGGAAGRGRRHLRGPWAEQRPRPWSPASSIDPCRRRTPPARRGPHGTSACRPTAPRPRRRRGPTHRR